MNSEDQGDVELWSDESIETDSVRQQLRDLGVRFLEIPVSDTELPALSVGGVLYNSPSDVDFALNVLADHNQR